MGGGLAPPPMCFAWAIGSFARYWEHGNTAAALAAVCLSHIAGGAWLRWGRRVPEVQGWPAASREGW